MSTEQNGVHPIAQLEVVITDTSALAVKDADRVALVATLKSIAERVPQAAQIADSLVIKSQTDAEEAARMRDVMLQNAATAEGALREFNGGQVAKLYRLWRASTDLIALFTDPFNDAAKKLKGKIIDYNEAQAEKARKEQARLQAEADERARRERDRLTKAAEKLKTPSLREQRMEVAAQVVAPQIYVPVPKAAVKTQKRWTVESIDKAKYFEAAAKDRSLQGFVEINTQALVRAKAANSLMDVPGVVFRQVVI